MTTKAKASDILFLLLIAAFFVLFFTCNPERAKAQTEWLRVQQGSGVPNNNPNQPQPKVGYVKQDSLTGNWYKWISGTSWKATNLFNGQPGKDGITPTFQTGNTITGAPGTNASLTIRPVSPTVYAVDASIPKGADGSGGGGSIAGIVTPEQFGACGCNNGTTDYNAIQAAINTGKKIEFDGTKTYYINGFLKRNKYKSLQIEGNFCTWIETSTASGDVLGCDQPTNATDAVVMVNYCVSVRNILVACNNKNQNAFNVRASSNSRFENVTVSNANWGFRSEFMLQSRYTECTVLGSTNGWYIGQGTFPGADANNSQSNYSWLIQPHTHTVTNVAVYVENTYGVRIDDIIVEGNGTIVNGIQFEATASTTTKNLYVNTGHFEQTGGLTGAFVKVNTRDAIVEVTDVIMHYSGLVIDATSTTGNGSILVTKCSYAVGVNGKYLKSNNTTWQFNYNNLFQCWNLPNLWVAPAPTRYGGNSGYNMYSCNDWGR